MTHPLTKIVQTETFFEIREEVYKVADEKDPRDLIVLTPCSDRNMEETLRHAEELARLGNPLFIVVLSE